ncbi:hypothetical protein ColLi_10688 [Colletotrichum liriopes]|uniref:Uncharacterized protein n=1 Tax=Colletotrichum liriopes TaxID=708192 RepID=A0AA37LWE4_9PEZI|nr:hypothetical protein ColLi_10688 [Colletotrichum liriopes]
MLMSSTLCLAFKVTAYNSYMEQTGWGTSESIVKSPSYGADGFINLYPKHLLPVVRAPLVVASSFGLVTGIAVTWLIARSIWIKRVQQRTTLITILSVNALLGTISMIYIFVQHSRSAHFDPGYVMTTTSYDHGLFSLEAWVCESSLYVAEFRAYDLEKQCMGERASRCLMVVLCFFCLVVLGLLVWDLNTTQVVVAKKKQKRENSWEDEGWE